jgi:hypothetical protein
MSEDVGLGALDFRGRPAMRCISDRKILSDPYENIFKSVSGI